MVFLKILPSLWEKDGEFRENRPLKASIKSWILCFLRWIDGGN